MIDGLHCTWRLIADGFPIQLWYQGKLVVSLGSMKTSLEERHILKSLALLTGSQLHPYHTVEYLFDLSVFPWLYPSKEGKNFQESQIRIFDEKNEWRFCLLDKGIHEEWTLTAVVRWVLELERFEIHSKDGPSGMPRAGQLEHVNWEGEDPPTEYSGILTPWLGSWTV